MDLEERGVPLRICKVCPPARHSPFYKPDALCATRPKRGTASLRVAPSLQAKCPILAYSRVSENRTLGLRRWRSAHDAKFPPFFFRMDIPSTNKTNKFIPYHLINMKRIKLYIFFLDLIIIFCDVWVFYDVWVYAIGTEGSDVAQRSDLHRFDA
jgi:hypothetical protein